MDMIGYIVGGAAIGGLASFAGGATGSALGSIANSGFLGGALASGSSAAASCFVSGTGFSLLNGDTFPQALWNGLISSGIGFAAGGIMGGLSSGIYSRLHGGGFWTGKGAIEEFSGGLFADPYLEVGQDMEYSNEYARAFSDQYFGHQRNVNKLYADGTFPDGIGYQKSGDIVLNKKGEMIFGLTYKNGLFKKADVFLFKAAFSSKEQLYLTMGHEYLHAAFYGAPFFGNSVADERHAAIYYWCYQQAKALHTDWFTLNRYETLANSLEYWLPGNPFLSIVNEFGIMFAPL